MTGTLQPERLRQEALRKCGGFDVLDLRRYASAYRLYMYITTTKANKNLLGWQDFFLRTAFLRLSLEYEINVQNTSACVLSL